jgi:hypothetical protein
MKRVNNLVCRWFVFLLLLKCLLAARGQGNITFDHALFGGTNYYQLGMWFRVIIPTLGTNLGTAHYDDLGVINSPNLNGTLYMIFHQQNSPDDYVSFSLTNGYTFGLVSVNLADPNSPSLSPVPISFVGLLSNGSTVTNTFTTPGGGATTFQNYLLTSAFASGLTSVDILATRWAMDNLVFGNVSQVPEPGAASLITVSLLAFAAHKFKTRRKP